MARKIKVKQILQLHEAGSGRNHIASVYHMAKDSVSDVIRIADQKGITFSQIKDMDEEDVYRLFYPDKYQSTSIYQQPDYEYIHKELEKVGVTLKTLWQEYRDECQKNHTVPMDYRRLCEGYANYTIRLNLTNHIYHKPGERAEVDWSGPTMTYTDPATGEVVTVYLFVAVLSFSMYAYVEPTLDMKMKSWIECNVHMLEHFQGVPNSIKCDNLKTGVVSHPREGDIILTEDYSAFGEYYMTAILPADVRKPKQKAGVEGTVGQVAKQIIAKLCNEHFTSLAALKAAVARKLDEFNKAPFQKRDGSRYLAWQEEKKFLHPLPETPYEYAEWSRGHSVGVDFHVIYNYNRYSVPYQYASKSVDLRITEHHLEVYYQGKRIAIHNLLPSYIRYKPVTLPEHMPPEFMKVKWDKERILNWAQKIGPNTCEVVTRIFQQYRIKEQGYNPSLSVLRLSKTYSPERLESACELALIKYRVPRYHHLKALLKADQDKVWKEKKESEEKQEKQLGYIRGKEYFGGDHHD